MKKFRCKYRFISKEIITSKMHPINPGQVITVLKRAKAGYIAMVQGTKVFIDENDMKNLNEC